MTQDKYIYILVRRDLSPIQQLVQATHAGIESARQFLPIDHEHPHLVVCGVKGEEQLKNTVNKLKSQGIRFAEFIEPDRNNELTAAATAPIFGEDRRYFKNFNCLKL